MTHRPTIRGSISLEQLWAASRCPPNGFSFGRVLPWTYCKWTACPHCYGRAIYAHYCALCTAWATRPQPDRPVYVARVSDHASTPPVFAQRLRKLAPAAAVAVYLPSWHPEIDNTGPAWFNRAVMLTDDRAQIADYQAIQINHPRRLVYLLSRWLSYPALWSKKPGWRSLVRAHDLLQQLPARTRLFATYGACRADFVPRKGLMDWVHYDDIR